MNDRRFVDTNILVYAHDLDAGIRHDQAVALLKTLWESETGMLSTQVLQEFYVNVTLKIPAPLSPAIARGLIDAYRTWRIEINTLDTVLQASEIQERDHLSFWDAMIVAAAARGGASILLTEDLNPGQFIEGVEVRNPFLH